MFRLELPSHKSIGVKAKQGKTVAEVILMSMISIVVMLVMILVVMLMVMLVMMMMMQNRGRFL